MYESGPSLAVVLSGGEVLGVNLFLVPNILCNVVEISNIIRMFIYCF